MKASRSQAATVDPVVAALERKGSTVATNQQREVCYVYIRRTLSTDVRLVEFAGLTERQEPYLDRNVS